MAKNNNTTTKQAMQFAAINPFIISNEVLPTEKKISGKEFIYWGDDNRYSDYLFDLYNNVATLQSVINGCADYVCGDNIVCNEKKFSKAVNKQGDTVEDLIQHIAMDYLIFGGFAIQVIRNNLNEIAELYWIDFSKLRSNEKNDVLFYSKDWVKTYGRVKYLVYPAFGINDNNSTSIYYFKGNKSRGTYPTPLYNAAIKCCELEKKINNFHINEISNNFLTSKIINFCNGIPTDEMKEEIEKNLNEKFSGEDNAGRVMITFNQSADNAPTILDLNTDDFADRYTELAKRSREQIYCAFRAIPAIFGINPENTGFSLTEYQEAYKLFNRTVIAPIQKIIKAAFEKILNMEEAITITPFSIEDNTQEIIK